MDTMKSPEEMRRDLNAARAAYQARFGLCGRFGWTSGVGGVSDYQLASASVDDAQWEALLDEYLRMYTRIWENQERFEVKD